MGGDLYRVSKGGVKPNPAHFSGGSGREEGERNLTPSLILVYRNLGCGWWLAGS